MLAEADRSGATTETGAGNAADWLAVESRQVRRDARSDLRLAQALDRYDVLSAAMSRGSRSTPLRPARSSAALDRLPTTGEFAVSAEQRTEAETYLVSLAEHHDAKALRILGGRIFEVIAPDLAEKFDGQALEAEEARALRRTTFTMFEDDEGTCHGRFRIPALHGQMLTKMILAISSPSRSTHDTASSSDIDPDLPTPVRHGIALTQLLETYPAENLPKTGGCAATIVVTMTLEQLLADLDQAGVCTLDTGGRITATEARRLACTAGIIPVVLGGQSQVLDVGRRRRLHTETMRITMSVRDGGCTARGCETPPGLCHAHHATPWSHAVHQRGQRSPPLPAPSPARARPALRDPTPTGRQGHLPPADVDSAWSLLPSSRRPVSISSPSTALVLRGQLKTSAPGQPVTARQWFGSGGRSNPP